MRNYLTRYGFIGLLRLALYVIRTKTLFPSARIIRFPFYLRGKKYCKIGKNFTTGIGCRIEMDSLIGKKNVLDIGDNVQINDYVHIGGVSSIVIGNDVLIASRVFISDHNHGKYSGDSKHSSPVEVPVKRALELGFVKIGDRVWIGENVSILPNTIIGEGSIIGANSVVTKSIPANVIAVGSPAKPIKKFDFKKEIWIPIDK